MILYFEGLIFRFTQEKIVRNELDMVNSQMKVKHAIRIILTSLAGLK